jgi:hypothetical protein
MESSRFVSCALALAVLATGQLAAAAPITVSPANGHADGYHAGLMAETEGGVN